MDEIQVPDFLLGNPTNDAPERSQEGRSSTWGCQQDDDDAVFSFSSVCPSEANDFLRTHGELKNKPWQEPPKPPHEMLPHVTREALHEAQVHITQKTVRFNAQAHVRPEDDREVRRRLGLKHRETNQANVAGYERLRAEHEAKKPKECWNTSHYSDWMILAKEYEREHPLLETDPIPKGTEKFRLNIIFNY